MKKLLLYVAVVIVCLEGKYVSGCSTLKFLQNPLSSNLEPPSDTVVKHNFFYIFSRMLSGITLYKEYTE